MTERDFRLIGLGVRAGSVVFGTSGCREGLRKGGIHLVVLASDRSARTEEKIERLAVARGVRILEGPKAVELGSRFGRKLLQALGLRDANLASAVGMAERMESC